MCFLSIRLALLAVSWGDLVLLKAVVFVFSEVVMVRVRVSEMLTSGGSEVVLTLTSGGSERSNDEIEGRPF